MEQLYSSSDNNTALFPLSVLLDPFFYQRICLRGNTLQKSFAKFWSFLRSLREVGNSTSIPKPRIQELSSGRRSDHGDGSPGFLRREEVELVIGRLGIGCSQVHGGGIREVYGPDEVSGVMEEREASLEEVEEAFKVFDGNRDGFIDAEDLQRVLCRLGFEEGKEIEDCEKMIGAFDRNGDGKIGLEEFVMLLENN